MENIWLIASLVGLFLLLFFNLRFLIWLNSRTKALNTNIEQLLRKNTLHDVCTKLAIDSVDIFGFDYSVVSIVSFDDRRIKSSYYYTNKKIKLGRAHPEEWIHQSDYSMDDQDILVGIIKTNQSCKADKNVLDKEIRDKEGIVYKLNQTISPLHENIIRIYIPITYTSEKNESLDVTLGVVELGFKNSIVERISWKRLILSGSSLFERTFRYLSLFGKGIFAKFATAINESTNQNIYINLLAQHTYNILLRDALRDSEKSIFNNISYEFEEDFYPDNYLKNSFEKICVYFKVKYGLVAFDTFNSPNINFIDKTLYFGGIDKNNIVGNFRESFSNEASTKKGITALVMETGEPYFTVNSAEAGDDPYYIKSLDKKVISELVAPLVRDKKVIGVLVLDSDKYYYFNSIYAAVVTQLAAILVQNYLRKSRYVLYQAIAVPKNPWEKIEDVYKYTAEQLASFFSSKHTLVWVRKKENKSLVELKRKLSLNNSLHLTNEVHLIGSLTQHNNQLVQILTCNDEKEIEQGFKSYLLLSFSNQNQIELLIQVFSKRHLPTDYLLGETDFLLQVINRVSVTVQGLKLIKSFSEIANTLTSSSSSLSDIAWSAYHAMNADIVSYFSYHGRSISRKDGIYVGNLSAEFNPTEQKGEAVMANLIVKHGSQWFKDIQVFIAFLQKHGIVYKSHETKDGFPYLNKIVSFAAIRIEHQGKIIGVLFFNYRNAVDFDKQKNLRDLIEDYSRFFGLYIATRELLTDIKKELNVAKDKEKELVDNVSVLQQKQAKITADLENKQKEIQKIEIELSEVLPRATRTSFYEILEGINHNVKHSLFEIFLNLKRIDKSNPRFTKEEKQIVSRSLDLIKDDIKIIENLLRMFDFSSQAKEKVDLNDLLDKVVEFFQVDYYKSIKFLRLYKINPLWIVVNRAEFTMIFYNLFNNAVHAIRQRESELVLSHTYEGRIEVETDLLNGEFVIKITDNGIGIDSEVKKRIFERGFSTKKSIEHPVSEYAVQGTGIGLYFVAQILDTEYSSYIDCRSRLGHWTEFTIHIPKFGNI